MESTRHLYIVSFGDSDKYRFSFTDSDLEGARKDTPLVKLENELNAYLKERFPESTFAYFTTPKVTEIDPSHESQYMQYPELDDKAVEAIKKVLVTEVKEMEAARELNDNAPYANAPV